MAYETTPEGDQFLRDFIIKWMMAHFYEVPPAATPSELLKAIATSYPLDPPGPLAVNPQGRGRK